MANPNYKVTETKKTEQGTKYLFVSKGKVDVIKAIEYSYVLEYNGKKVYNLGFGDFDSATGKTDDSILTDNGDAYPVFNTVLSTIPMFFENYPNHMMIVWGSDSTEKFIDRCKEICDKKCIDFCKKADRRINLYSKYVNKNFEELNKEYKFYGGVLNAENKIVVEEYVPNKKYKSVLVIKNNA